MYLSEAQQQCEEWKSSADLSPCVQHVSWFMISLAGLYLKGWRHFREILQLSIILSQADQIGFIYNVSFDQQSESVINNLFCSFHLHLPLCYSPLSSCLFLSFFPSLSRFTFSTVQFSLLFSSTPSSSLPLHPSLRPSSSSSSSLSSFPLTSTQFQQRPGPKQGECGLTAP